MPKAKTPLIQELQIVEPTPTTEMIEMARNSGLLITEAQSIAIKFAPYMATVNEYGQLISNLEKENPTENDAKLAREYRLKLVANRGKNGMDITHTELKAGIVVKGKLIDNLYNTVENTSKLSEIEAESIEKYQERLAAKKATELAEQRVKLLAEFGTDTSYLPLSIMTDEQFDRLIENESLAFTARKEATEKAEAARMEAERLAEEKRLADIEADRLARIEQAEENERLRKEKAIADELLAKEREATIKEAKRLADIAEAENKKRDAELAKEREASAKLAEELRYQKEAKDKAEQEEKARIEAEESEKIAREKAALAAPDKDKVRQLHTALKSIVVPEFETKEGKEIGNTMREALDILIKGLVSDSKKLL